MTARPPTTPRAIGAPDLAALVYLGAVWGAAFLFFRVASPEVGPVWTAEVRIALAGLAIAVFIGPRRGWGDPPPWPQPAVLRADLSAVPVPPAPVPAAAPPGP